MTTHASRRLMLALGLSLLGDLLWVSIKFPTSARSRTFTLESLPPVKAPALVLGASVTSDREPSPVLRARLQTALELYQAGKVSWFLLSGDNRSQSYNEPIAMRRWLLRQGVPPTAIVTDFAGRRTWDSLRRAQAVFGVERMVIVTSGFHLPRALFIARCLDIEAYGVAPSNQDVSFPTQTAFWCREHLARHAAIWDSWFPPATTLGPREPTPEDWMTPTPKAPQ